MPERAVGVLGATSLVGDFLLPALAQRGWRVTAYSRRHCPHPAAEPAVEWRQLSAAAPCRPERALESWVCAAPIWTLADYFGFLEAHGARTVVALSSTSRLVKHLSPDPAERAVAEALREGESRLQSWAAARGIRCVILRPTLIHGGGRDRNIAEIARFIRRFGFFPIFGKAAGLRQPIHAADVAAACAAALEAAGVQGAYDISGGETIPYREMVARVFTAMGRPVRLLPIPLWGFRAALALLRPLPPCRHWCPAMAERMNSDLVFDHGDAARDLAFKPRGFVPEAAIRSR